MIVPDASAVGLLFCDPDLEPRAAVAREMLAADPAWAVPEHWRIEVLSVIRGLFLGGTLRQPAAERAVETLRAMEVATAHIAGLIGRIWELRANLSAYDAGYVALAEQRDCTLVTSDARIHRARVARCPVRLID